MTGPRVACVPEQAPVFRELYSEKRVVAEERRARIDNAPMGRFQVGLHGHTFLISASAHAFTDLLCLWRMLVLEALQPELWLLVQTQVPFTAVAVSTRQGSKGILLTPQAMQGATF